MTLSVLHLVPNLIGPPGGIARYCRMVCNVVLESKIKLSLVALLDSTSAIPEARAIFPGMPYYPCQGSRLDFIYQAIVTAVQSRPAIILVGHANFTPLGWFLAQLTQAKMVTSVHGVDVWQPLSALHRWSLQRSDLILSVSRFTTQKAKQANGIKEKQIRILPNCLDPQFEPRRQAAQSKPTLSMLTVARMSLAEQYKGHDYVIKAMPALLQQFPQLVYNIVGDGDGRPALEQLAIQSGVTHAVRFHGVISEAELQRCYNEASLCIMPSRGEGFGIVFLEAMAQGVPVIGGNVDATPEVIVDGQTGCLVNPTSVEAIAAAAARLLADAGLRRQMGQAAQRHVAEKFSYAQFRQKLVAYLAELQAMPQAEPDLA